MCAGTKAAATPVAQTPTGAAPVAATAATPTDTTNPTKTGVPRATETQSQEPTLVSLASLSRLQGAGPHGWGVGRGGAALANGKQQQQQPRPQVQTQGQTQQQQQQQQLPQQAGRERVQMQPLESALSDNAHQKGRQSDVDSLQGQQLTGAAAGGGGLHEQGQRAEAQGGDRPSPQVQHELDREHLPSVGQEVNGGEPTVRACVILCLGVCVLAHVCVQEV